MYLKNYTRYNFIYSTKKVKEIVFEGLKHLKIF